MDVDGSFGGNCFVEEQVASNEKACQERDRESAEFVWLLHLFGGVGFSCGRCRKHRKHHVGSRELAVIGAGTHYSIT